MGQWESSEYSDETRDILVDGVSIGIQDKFHNIGYQPHGRTQNSPLLNKYAPKKGIDIWVSSNNGNWNVSSKPVKGAHKGHFINVEQIYQFGKACEIGDMDKANELYNYRPADHNYHVNDSSYYYGDRNFRENYTGPDMAAKWMKVGMKAKYEQDPFARKALLATQGNHLVSGTDTYQNKDVDSYWSAPIDTDLGIDHLRDANEYYPDSNHQGKMTEQVRDEMLADLTEEQKNDYKKNAKPHFKALTDNQKYLEDLNNLDM